MSSARKLDDLTNTVDQTLPVLLLVDDQRFTSNIEHSYFVGVGFTVHLATTRLEVLRAIKSENIDVLVIDAGFQKNHGISVLTEAKRRSRNPNLKVLLTSVVSSTEIRRFVESGNVDGFLSKPTPRPKLLKEVKRLSEQRSRDTERVIQKLSISYNWNGILVQGISIDISCEGLHIEWKNSETRPQIGGDLELRLQLPDLERPLKISGTVVRHTDRGFGLKFAKLNTPVKRALDRFLIGFSLESKVTPYYL